LLPESALQEYCENAISLTDYISTAAKMGKLKLREWQTGAVLTGWLEPDKPRWWALFNSAINGREPEKVGELALYLTRMPMHFQRDVAVNLAEFEEWAIAEKLVDPGEVARLLSEDTPDNLRLLMDGVPVCNDGPQAEAERVQALTCEEDKPKKIRRDLITSAIEVAKTECKKNDKDPDDTNQVWFIFRGWAESRKQPFIGVTEDGLKWSDADDSIKFLTKKSLDRRMKRFR